MADKPKAAACKCKKKGECEECPEWIFTFADLVMLMMGFFVILWVLKPAANPKSSVGPESTGAASAAAADQHWIDTVAAVRQAFGATGDPSSSDPVSRQLAKRQLMSTPAGADNAGKSMLQSTGQSGIDQEVQAIRRSNASVTGGAIMFGQGGADLSPDVMKQIDQVATAVKGHRNIVLVQGHTALDDMDAGTPQQKMDLSLRRAQAVADRLVSRGVDPDVIRVVGSSTFEPVVAGEYGANAQAGNRRVEVQVTNMPVTDVQAAHSTTTDGGK